MQSYCRRISAYQHTEIRSGFLIPHEAVLSVGCIHQLFWRGMDVHALYIQSWQSMCSCILISLIYHLPYPHLLLHSKNYAQNYEFWACKNKVTAFSKHPFFSLPTLLACLWLCPSLEVQVGQNNFTEKWQACYGLERGHTPSGTIIGTKLRL